MTLRRSCIKAVTSFWIKLTTFGGYVFYNSIFLSKYTIFFFDKLYTCPFFDNRSDVSEAGPERMISSLWIKNGIIEGYWDKTSSGRFYTWNKEINNTRLTFAGLSWCLLTWIVLRIWLFRLLSCLNLKTKNKQITQNLLPLEIDHHLLIQIQMFYRNRSPIVKKIKQTILSFSELQMVIVKLK